MAATGDGLESKDLQAMISDRNETAEMMVKRVWPRVDSWKVQWSKKLTSMRFKVRWHDDSPKASLSVLLSAHAILLVLVCFRKRPYRDVP